jgi:hypothetical protein
MYAGIGCKTYELQGQISHTVSRSSENGATKRNPSHHNATIVRKFF